MIKASIIGGAGYTAGELIRLLVNHPHVQIASVHSASNAGARITDVHTGLYGDTDLVFDSEPELSGVDVVFLCTPHGKSKEFLSENKIEPGVKIIDLSQDFRDETNGFVYGLPELNRSRIAEASRIANPGCFATALQLALLPAAKAGIIDGSAEVTALTGSTGAGVKPSATTHFSYRNSNVSTYKEFSHQHLAEISRSLASVAPDSIAPVVNFVPVRGDFARGIFASAYFKSNVSEEEAVKLYLDFYAGSTFTHVVTDKAIDLKQVVNTNKALVHVVRHGDLLHVTSIIDNLLKGASGQAVENMNIAFGLDPKEGLRLKASAF